MKRSALAAALVLLSTVRAFAAPAAAPAGASFETDARIEALSVVLMLADPEDFALSRAGIKDAYADEARAAFSRWSGSPAVSRAASILKRGVPPRALARLVVEGSADPALAAESAAFRAELNDFMRASGFAGFYEKHRAAYKSFADDAKAESLRAMSPKAAAAYLGRPLAGVRFVLAPLFPEDEAGEDDLQWRSGGTEFRLRPRGRAEGASLGFLFDVPERCVAHALVEATAASWVKPPSRAVSAHLAHAVRLRVLAADLGEAAYRAALQSSALARWSRLEAVAESLREYEASRAKHATLESFYPRLSAIARLRLDEATAAVRASDRKTALAVLTAVLAQNPDAETRRGALALLEELKEYASARAVIEGLLAENPADAGLRVRAAALAARTGDRAAALAALGAALKNGPDAAALRAAARLYLDLGELEAARAPLDALIAASPKEIRLRLDRASVAARTGERAAALDQLAVARGLKADADTKLHVASLYQDLSEHKLARAVLDELVRSSPNDAALRVARAEAAAVSGDRAAAARFLAEARKMPADAAVRRRMAALYSDLGDFASARNLADELMKNAPGDAALRLDRAAFAAAEGDRDAALSFLSQARKLGPDAAGLRRMAELYGRLKEYPVAQVLLSERIKAAPSDTGLLLDLAELAAKSGDEKTALGALASARAQKLDAPSARRAARLYQAFKRHADAASLLDDLIKTSPKDPAVRVDRAELAARTGDGKAAVEFLVQAQALSPDRSERRRMALIKQDLKDYEGALRLLEALAKEKAESGVFADIGVCKILAGRPADAVADLNAAIKLDPTQLAPYFTLGSVYAQRKEYAKELAVYESAPMPERPTAQWDELTKSIKEASMRVKPAIVPTVDPNPGPPGRQPPAGSK